ncbi:MAG: rhodoquinone biosynthesis methyltransferase RquA [Gammaproteobacteria bacterium]|nr:rhodoquinone biosynthesis methyltransferase RquA [Gammaproteobacteria bacterium]
MDDITRSPSYPDSPTSLAIAIDESKGLEWPEAKAAAPDLPDYLQDTYHWAYIHPRNVRLLDREIVVRTILWQQHLRLQRLAFAEIEPGQSVLQPASVYGSFVPNLAAHVGPGGRFDVVDVAQVQVESARRKLRDHPHATAYHANILHFRGKPYDAVVCYFLLHEVPEEVKFQVVNHLLDKVEPGGKVVFVDYHKPRWWHPLKLITSIVFDTLEPFAKGLWRRPIRDYAQDPDRFEWRKETIFGQLFQKVVATRMH